MMLSNSELYCKNVMDGKKIVPSIEKVRSSGPENGSELFRAIYILIILK